MTEQPPASPNGFERDKPGTKARDQAEAAIEKLRQQGGVFVEAVKATRMPMAITDVRLPGNPIVFANAAFLELTGYGMEEVLGQGPHFMSGPDSDTDHARRFREAIEKDEDVTIETWQYRRDGTRFCAAVFCRPLKDEQGRPSNHFLSYLDITRRVEAEEDLRQRVAELDRHVEERARSLAAVDAERRQSEERLRLIVKSALDYAIFTTDAEGTIDQWYEGAASVFGWTAEEAIGRSMDMTFTPEDQEQGAPETERETAALGGWAPNVRWHLRKDGKRIFIEGTSRSLRNSTGDLIGFLKIGQDVTERRRAEEHQRTLLAELQHRVRNTLSIVRSIARRTAETSETAEEMASHFQGRLDAFSRVQAAVTRKPDGGVDLIAMIEDELLAHAAREGENLVLRGPEVCLRPRAAESLSLAIHELASNAVKYGVLSAENGHLEVTWVREDGEEGEQLRLRWEESGLDGIAEPTRQGFGMELLQRSLPYDLRAETQVDFRPQGLRFTMKMPLGPDVLAQ